MYITIHEPQGKRIFRSRQTFKEYLSQFIQIEAAGGMVLNGKGELLMMFRRGKWDMPKGKLDEGETIKECALREVREETGLTHLKVGRKLQVTYHTYAIKGKNIIKPSHWYFMKYDGNEVPIPQTEEDITEVRWVNKKEAAKLIDDAYASIREIVKKYYLD
ncbi:MAG: NUDIX hydrolase [Chitinophagaceae bacterium]|jgi:8-oxo-dGTP pyrophosphatase MutT (NUDIX family)